VQSFIVIGEGVWILWVVKVWPFPLDCDVAVNTGGRPSTCETENVKYNAIKQISWVSEFIIWIVLIVLQPVILPNSWSMYNAPIETLGKVQCSSKYEQKVLWKLKASGKRCIFFWLFFIARNLWRQLCERLHSVSQKVPITTLHTVETDFTIGCIRVDNSRGFCTGWPWNVFDIITLKKSLNRFCEQEAGLEKFGIYLEPFRPLIEVN